MENQAVSIFGCANGHYFLEIDRCPFCGDQPSRVVEYRSGDCISCGQLCPEFAYGCDHPRPLDIQAVLEKLRSQNFRH